MRKIYKNKIYDTSTSEVICKVNQWQTLYRKNSTIDFYLMSNSGQVQPLKWQQARELTRQYAPSYLYRKYFLPERSKARASIDTDKETYSMLRIMAGANGMPVKKFHKKLIRDRYKAYEKHLPKEYR